MNFGHVLGLHSMRSKKVGLRCVRIPTILRSEFTLGTKESVPGVRNSTNGYKSLIFMHGRGSGVENPPCRIWYTISDIHVFPTEKNWCVINIKFIMARWPFTMPNVRQQLTLNPKTNNVAGIGRTWLYYWIHSNRNMVNEYTKHKYQLELTGKEIFCKGQIPFLAT